MKQKQILINEPPVASCMHCLLEDCVAIEFTDNYLSSEEWGNTLEDLRLGDGTDDSVGNNIIRKTLYRNFIIETKYYPLVAGHRKELPRCVTNVIRTLYPSEAYVGFQEQSDVTKVPATDVDGAVIKNVFWLLTETGWRLNTTRPDPQYTYATFQFESDTE